MEVENLQDAHGGPLVLRLSDPTKTDEMLQRNGPVITLSRRSLSDLELIATGGYSPLTGFMGKKDYLNVLSHMRLENGTVWPIPITLTVQKAEADASTLR